MNQVSLKTGIIILALSMGLAWGCINATLPANYTPPVVNDAPIPLRVGLVLDKNLRQFKITGVDLYIDAGPALSQAAQSMARQAFREVVVINVDAAPDMNAFESPPKIDVLVIPEFKGVKFSSEKVNYLQSAIMTKVFIKWTIVKDKRVLYANTFAGEYCRFGTGTDQSLSFAIKDQFDQAYRGIVGSSWWKSLQTASPK